MQGLGFREVFGVYGLIESFASWKVRGDVDPSWAVSIAKLFPVASDDGHKI